MIEDVTIRHYPGKTNWYLEHSQELVIPLRVALPCRGPAIQMRQLRGNDRRLNCVQTEVAADHLVMNQKLEANTLKVVANNSGYQVKGDVRINGQAASLDYRKPNEGDADIKLQAMRF